MTTGPYRFVRHPLDVAEYIASVGVLIHFLSPWTVLITLCQGYLQIRRMDDEERLLARVFPEYAAYAERTARILPASISWPRSGGIQTPFGNLHGTVFGAASGGAGRDEGRRILRSGAPPQSRGSAPSRLTSSY